MPCNKRLTVAWEQESACCCGRVAVNADMSSPHRLALTIVSHNLLHAMHALNPSPTQ
jgi:hypothetical protein